MPSLYARLENHTVCYLRDLLLTNAHKDPVVTSFLTFWNLEEFWHRGAIAPVPADLRVVRVITLRNAVTSTLSSA